MNGHLGMSLKSVFVIGCGGHAKVVSQVINSDDSYEIVAYVDEQTDTGDFLGKPLMAEGRLQKDHNDSAVFVAIGFNDERQRVAKNLTAMGQHSFPSFTHVSASLAPDTILGRGVVIMPNAALTANTTIGDFCVINTSSILEHDCVVGDFSSLAPGAIVCGECRIGENVYIGAGAMIKQGVTIGDNSVIGAGSVILQDVGANLVVVGAPGRAVKSRKIYDPYF